MGKKITILAILIASLFIGLAPVGSAMTKADASVTSGAPSTQISVRIDPQRRRYRRAGYWRNGRWYRNYASIVERWSAAGIGWCRDITGTMVFAASDTSGCTCN